MWYHLVINWLYNSSLATLIKTIQSGHIIIIQLKPIQIGVGLDASWCITLRKRNEAPL